LRVRLLLSLPHSQAVSVTYHYNRRQHEISLTQRDLALDKLKFDAWEKRYEIYSQARELLSYVAHQHDMMKVDSSKVRNLKIKIDEARFFFGPTVRLFLDEIDGATELLLKNLGERFSVEVESDDTKWRAINEELAKNSQEIGMLYAKMPERFEQSLRLSQLARD